MNVFTPHESFSLKLYFVYFVHAADTQSVTSS